ncbi:hypothetical protein SEA_SOOS_23 [Gordonia phage Soos]|nr:hypothetical protein SEA_SOOS_23 [Gordonia phage Soos]
MNASDYRLGDQVKHLSVRHPFTQQPAIGLVSGHTSDGYVLVSFPEPLRQLKVWPDDLTLHRRLLDQAQADHHAPPAPARCDEEGPNGQCDKPAGHSGECLRKANPIDPDQSTYPIASEYIEKAVTAMQEHNDQQARATIREGRHPGTVHLLDLFEYGHLPPHLAVISAKFEVLAHDLVLHLQDGPELTAGLRKLVEAKDCAVRQAVADHKAQ